MSKASPELLRHLDDTPRDELLGWFNVLCRHLALCVDPDGTIHPYDPQFLDMLQILAAQVELVTADAATVRDHLLHRLAVCTRELTSGATDDPVVVKRWVLACGELVADSVAATLVAANVLDG